MLTRSGPTGYIYSPSLQQEYLQQECRNQITYLYGYSKLHGLTLALVRPFSLLAPGTPGSWSTSKKSPQLDDVPQLQLQAYQLGEDMVKLAEMMEDPIHLSFAYHHISASALYLGQLRTFLEFHQRAIELYDRGELRTTIFPQGLDPKVVGLAHAVWGILAIRLS